MVDLSRTGWLIWKENTPTMNTNRFLGTNRLIFHASLLISTFQLTDGMVCWTVVEEEPIVNLTTIDNRHTMEVQRAKKCKLWSEEDGQPQEKQKPPPPLPADPCPILMPFCHQVSQLVSLIKDFLLSACQIKR